MVSSDLMLRIEEVINEAIASPDNYALWRDMIADEEWKIIVQCDDESNSYNIRCIKRST